MTKGTLCAGSLWLTMCMAAIWPDTALAQDDSSESPFGLEIHGFVSQGFIYTTDNQFLAESEKGSFEFTEIGINFTKQLSEEFRFGAQLFSRDLGPDGNYKATFDWFYLDYRFVNWFGLRAGRTKLPVGLYNETSDIDAARAPVLLPQSLYPARNRDYLLAQTGLEVYGYLPLGVMGAFDYRLYGGTIYFEAPYPQQNVDTSIPYIAGGRAMWFTPLDGLSTAFSALALRLEQDAFLPDEAVTALQMAGLLPADFDGIITLSLPIKAWVASLEYAAYDLQLSAEYTRSYTDFETSDPQLNPLLFPPDGEPPYPVRSKGYYTMASYRVTPWFTPGVYYSYNRTKLDLPDRRDRHLHDLAFFVRYDLTSYWLLKLEGHAMNGTAGLDARLNGHVNSDGQPDEEALKDLTRLWGAFLIKTTGYF